MRFGWLVLGALLAQGKRRAAFVHQNGAVTRAVRGPTAAGEGRPLPAHAVRTHVLHDEYRIAPATRSAVLRLEGLKKRPKRAQTGRRCERDGRIGSARRQRLPKCTKLCATTRRVVQASVYNLMISRWANVTEEGDGPIPVDILLEHCDPVSPLHYVGLVVVGSIGFTSTMLLLCVVGEFVLGLRTITKLQKAAQRDQFVELAQIDPLKAKSCEKEEADEDLEEPTAPLMTTMISSDSGVTGKTTTESEKESSA